MSPIDGTLCQTTIGAQMFKTLALPEYDPNSNCYIRTSICAVKKEINLYYLKMLKSAGILKFYHRNHTSLVCSK
jgi:hypothetical protein